jgi:hypothetical protein
VLLLTGDNAHPSVCSGGAHVSGMGWHRRERLACMPAALWPTAAVDPKASVFVSNSAVLSEERRQALAREEVARWMTAGFCRRASAADVLAIRVRGRVRPAFVTCTASKPR